MIRLIRKGFGSLDLIVEISSDKVVNKLDIRAEDMAQNSPFKLLRNRILCSFKKEFTLRNILYRIESL